MKRRLLGAAAIVIVVGYAAAIGGNPDQIMFVAGLVSLMVFPEENEDTVPTPH